MLYALMANAQQSPEGATHAFDECGDIFGGGCNGSRDNNVLILSLYLIDSEDDILHHNTNTNNNNDVDDVKKRARLYRRLCQACNIANDILLQSSSHSSTNNDDNNNNNYRPWSSGGDGPIFGIHCNNTFNDIYNNNNNGMNNNMDGDDIWQSQSPTNHHDQQQQQQKQQSTTSSSSSSREEDVSTNKSEISYNDALELEQQQQQPHLRAKYNYNNDINDLWRCISLSLQISSTLSRTKEDHGNNNKLKCAIEIWDNNDGHILL